MRDGPVLGGADGGDLTDAVDVALDDVSAEPAVGAHRTFQIHGRADTRVGQ